MIGQMVSSRRFACQLDNGCRMSRSRESSSEDGHYYVNTAQAADFREVNQENLHSPSAILASACIFN